MNWKIRKSHPDWRCYIPQSHVFRTYGRNRTLPMTAALAPKSTAFYELRDSAPFVRIIGDAHRVSTITNAVYEGYHAALDI